MFPSGEFHPLSIYRQGGKLKAYSDCPGSRPIPTSHYMDATQLHPRSRQCPRRMDLENPTRSNPHANHDWLVRSRGMGSRLQNLLQVKHPHVLTPSISATMCTNPGSLIEIYGQEAGSNNMKVVHRSNVTTTACRQIASYEPGARPWTRAVRAPDSRWILLTPCAARWKRLGLWISRRRHISGRLGRGLEIRNIKRRAW